MKIKIELENEIIIKIDELLGILNSLHSNISNFSFITIRKRNYYKEKNKFIKNFKDQFIRSDELKLTLTEIDEAIIKYNQFNNTIIEFLNEAKK